jgi:catechol 2,3-dioxygenase-like lactoylglutathione lyase family enzyme
MMACTLPRQEIRSAPHHAGADVGDVDNLTGDVDGVVAETLGLRTMTGMACRISELVIDAADPERLAAFWSDVLGYVELGQEDDGSIEIGPPGVGFGGPQPTLILSPSSDPRAGKLRLHIDVNATDRDQDAELERLLALGARPADVGQTGTESWHVLADPEGNEFCLLRTRLQPL